MREDLQIQTKKYALNVTKLYQSLPKSEESGIPGKQFLRCATSVAANYRSSLRARSTAEFIAKPGIVAGEADESAFWMELLIESEIVTQKQGEKRLNESKELLKIFSASRKTAKENQKITKSLN